MHPSPAGTFLITGISVVETYFTFPPSRGYNQCCATLIRVLNNPRIPATVCGAALLAGVATVAPAEAAVVSGPVAIEATQGSNFNRCEIQFTDEERAFVEEVEFVNDASFIEAAWLDAFEVTFPDAKKLGDATRKRLQNPTFQAIVIDDLEGFISTLVNHLKEKGIDEAAASWYVDELIEEAFTDPNTGLDQRNFQADLEIALTEGYIDAPRETDLYDGGMAIPSSTQLLADLKKQYPGMDSEQLEAWVEAFDQSATVANARKAQQVQNAFQNARVLCARGKSGAVAFPTAETTTTYSGASLADNTAIDGAIDDGVGSSQPREENVEEEAGEKDGENDTTAPAGQSSVKNLDTGAVIGIIAAVLAALGIAGAAFALFAS